MKTFALVSFAAGLLLAVRVMFFGVQTRVDDAHTSLRRWPLALATFLVLLGAALYARAARIGAVSPIWLATAVAVAVVGASGAWWLVQRSANVPSTDPDDDPHYRFQGQVARVVEGIASSAGSPPTGRIAFDYDGKRYEFRARWTPGDWEPTLGRADSEVVIERVDDDLAYVEPWAAIEERL